jgi:hypothetical protein
VTTGAEHPRYRGPVIDVHVHYDQHSRHAAAGVNRLGGLSAAFSVWDLRWPPAPFEDDLVGWQRLEPGLARCLVPDLSDIDADGFAADLRAAIRSAAELGCVGIKVWKNLGLFIRDSRGSRVRVDDPRLATLWDAAADHDLPVLIHVGDPPDFWRPVTPANPRYHDIKDRPEWWYGKGGFPELAQLHEEFRNVVEAHPGTAFVAAHFGCFVPDLEPWFRAFDNFHVDTAAAVAEIGKGDVSGARSLMERWPERFLFGTDLGRAEGFEYPDLGRDRWDLGTYFRRHWDFFETATTGLEHPIPEQLPWKVSGLDLSDATLDALYLGNARRLYHVACDRLGL